MHHRQTNYALITIILYHNCSITRPWPTLYRHQSPHRSRVTPSNQRHILMPDWTTSWPMCPLLRIFYSWRSCPLWCLYPPAALHIHSTSPTYILSPISSFWRQYKAMGHQRTSQHKAYGSSRSCSSCPKLVLDTHIIQPLQRIKSRKLTNISNQFLVQTTTIILPSTYSPVSHPD